ncbi:MAG: bifunctional [glutamine synthetase] adenylyltransferase/[glutamine synthetase]-adenylyl-L-tyrosine phosphorylase, partial [Pseudomonadota bacterium]|nr:bifunctional [glutamine synthetase] adenylyltransferase/[glutamine synthetase]-adenylyl-L-tyrosine phosphorylase [Pseudomonadota bacterium]
KSFPASVYYNRLAQRLLNALTAMGRDGRLYEVDTRLRPSGEEGLLAVSLEALTKYFDSSAWTFEFMAFTKARMIAGDAALCHSLNAFIGQQLNRPRDTEKLRVDVFDMRERIAREHGTSNPWNLKYVRGGLVDVDFIAEYLLLRHAPQTPGAQPGGASQIYGWLKERGLMPAAEAEQLIEADRFLGQIFHMLRLCQDHYFDESSALPGLRKLLAESAGELDFQALRERLIQVEQAVYEQYNRLLHA